MLDLLTNPAAWAALATLIVMEVVLGIDNLVFISVLTNKLPEEKRRPARRIGIGAALILRLALLSLITVIIALEEDLFEAFGHGFSVRDLILIAGGLFLVWKATREIHESMEPETEHTAGVAKTTATMSVSAAVVQILLLDMVFSIDSILTAIGMTDFVPVMFIAVIVAVGVMFFAADPLGNFIARNPTVVMLALGFLLMIGMTLIADGFGFHVPKGYIYAAMAFSAFVEALNVFARRRKGAAVTEPAA
ncbi:TerC family protein [Parvularcula dongshanensis]|uniref:Putative tellurium resistance membrane protein TerC n=1 Tax=Parvularcula dongshanensis TaxID=1173995 RepID=A0A840I0X3_9PROT|nr:TerC family protein [Parvularcula dongshanensis]MBB4657750.1 putative tellurium resistance membrane protein TerC [Parvularcula dongshanensis]